MRIEKNTPVRLKSFQGTLTPQEEISGREDYWKLVGEKGEVIDNSDINDDRVLVRFKNKLDDFDLENHNPIKNTLWIKKSDLEFDRYEVYHRKLDKEISKRACFMSNTKWFELFTTIEHSNLKIYFAQVKMLLSDQEYRFYFDGFDANGFCDGRGGPFKFKEIEWILIPEKYEIERWNRSYKLASEFIIQPLGEIENLMTSLRQFEYERTEDELKVFGYR